MTEMTPRFALFALSALCVGFAALIGVEVASIVVGGSTATAPVRLNSAVARKAELPEVDSLIDEILERPVFSSTRMPHESEPAEEAAEEKEPPELQSRLTGIMIGPGEREALFQDGDNEPVAVKVGGEIDGFKVMAIRAEEVVLSSELGDQVVKLTDVEGSGAAAPPPAMKKPLAKKISVKRPAAPAAIVPGKPPAQAQAAARAKPAALPAAAQQRGRGTK